jgi:hypothetical protein
MPHPRKSPEKFKKPNMLPGFQNAFMDSTPSRLSQRRAGKGKQREIDHVLGEGSGAASFQHLVSPPTSPIRCPQDMDTDVKMEVLDLFEDNDATVQQEDIPSGDMNIEMAEEAHNVSEEMEDADIIEQFDWKTEVPLNFTCFSIMPTALF